MADIENLRHLPPEKSTDMIETITLHDALNNEADYIRSIANTTPNATLNDVNVDDIITPGNYYLATGITGANNYSYLIVLKVSYNLTQISYTNLFSQLKVRNKQDGEWTDWKYITTQS